MATSLLLLLELLLRLLERFWPLDLLRSCEADLLRSLSLGIVTYFQLIFKLVLFFELKFFDYNTILTRFGVLN